MGKKRLFGSIRCVIGMCLWLAVMPAAPNCFAMDGAGSAGHSSDGLHAEERLQTPGISFLKIRAYRCQLFASGSGGNFCGAAPLSLAAGYGLPDGSGNMDTAADHTPDASARRHSWETGAGKSYLVPALEIPAFILALNGFDRLAFSGETEDGKKVFDTTPSTFWDHMVHGPWVFDKDAFDINQLGHPYQGSIYYGLARSTGLSYWESLGYTFVGSLLWEWGGETTDPSINDQVSTGIGGTFFGEPLFRMANLLLEGHARPGFFRELGAAAFSPPTGLNRLLLGERFDAVFPSHDPAFFWRVRFAATINTNVRGPQTEKVDRSFAAADFAMDYGLPGKPGYRYARPFDYFRFELKAVSKGADPVENIMSRGLLLGTKYSLGQDYRGIWGLYGSYDYISPRIFRISSTALSLGTTAQWWLSGKVALQGTGLAGIGYGAGGDVTDRGERHYHYGAVPQGLLSLRLILGELAMFELSGREYYVTAPGSTDPPGNELIGRYSAGLTVRISGPHALGIQYLASIRNVFYPDAPDINQRLGDFSIAYSYQCDAAFGAVQWRERNYQR